MIQEQYYVIERENNNSHPLISQEGEYEGMISASPITHIEVIRFKLDKPYPKQIEWVDYHSSPDPVISTRLAAVLEPLSIYGIQLLPAVIQDTRHSSLLTYDYVYLHVWNYISCLDKDQSICEYSKSKAYIFGIDKLVLDESKLQNIKLEDRLMIRLEEKTSVVLVHESVKQVIESIGAKGLRFFKSTEWNSDRSFDD